MPVDVEAEVLSNVRLSPEYNVLVLGAPDLAGRVEPGQFVMLKVSPGRDPLLRRPFSVFEVLADERGAATSISILSKRVGLATDRLAHAEAGARIGCLGPLGRPFTLIDPPAEAWMIAGGVGLAPFATLAERLHARGVAMTLFFGGRRRQDIFCVDRFERFGVRVVIATEDGSLGHCGRVTAPLQTALEEADRSAPLTIYACGPEPMLAAVARLAAHHARPSQLAMERIMGCGVGGCYSCVVRIRDGEGGTRYARSCVEGPIFRGEDVVWE
jgi:dihydroorotate dehydrogenase electron transfer subunit